MQRETVWLVEDEQGIADTLVEQRCSRKVLPSRSLSEACRCWIKLASRLPTLTILDVGFARYQRL